jgi:putative sigma-54 modulation protein
VRTTIKGKNLDVPPVVRAYAERKLHRLERLLDDRSEAVVELSREQHRSADDSHLVEVTLLIDGHPLRVRRAARTFQAALDELVDTVEREVVEFKARPRERARSAGRPQPPVAPGAEGTPAERQIVKVKRFAIEPMFEEDAIAAMEELGHAFFIFVNAETERLSVLYRRRNGSYGLIEPVIGGGYTVAPPGD